MNPILLDDLRSVAGWLTGQGLVKSARIVEEAWKELATARSAVTEVGAPWIACKDQLPPDGLPVLAYQPGNEYRCMAIGTVLQREDGIVWEFNNTTAHEKLNARQVFKTTEFTHWMPLPEAPRSPLGEKNP